MHADASARLQAGWVQLLAQLGVSADDARRAFTELAARYSSPDRHYHTLDHIAALLEALAGAGEAAADPAVLLAVWLHDVVYDSRAADNEDQSAAFAQGLLAALGLPGGLREEVRRLILLTKTHQVQVGDAAGRLLVDADLAILGAEPAAYDRYAQAIRREYAWVDEDAYRTGRRKVLEGFLQRGRIFSTPTFARLEAAARANLARESAALGQTPS
jgi:predicted metal-dependent HD superfamily phosphohydrolase